MNWVDRMTIVRIAKILLFLRPLSYHRSIIINVFFLKVGKGRVVSRSESGRDRWAPWRWSSMPRHPWRRTLPTPWLVLRPSSRPGARGVSLVSFTKLVRLVEVSPIIPMSIPFDLDVVVSWIVPTEEVSCMQHKFTQC